MNVLDLFSGIGGFSLGLERAGMRTVGFCEIDPYCRAVLAKHWPDVPIHGDIRKLADSLADSKDSAADNDGCSHQRNETDGRQSDRRFAGRGSVDVICGGFPCQPFSVAGKRRGAEDERHLWPQMLRVIEAVRPSWVIGENVAGLINMGLDGVLSDLAGAGFEVQPFVIPACAVDAPHRRDRLWIVAHAENQRGERHRRTRTGRPGPEDHSRWLPEPGMGRVAHGIPSRVDRLRALGNAVVPAVVQKIGEAIMKAEQF